MKISIITICFNSGETIEDTIKNVFSQTYKNIEYIVVDGVSKDNTMSILDRYKDKIDILISEPDNGIYDAMNKGIELASGDIIGILNSDDLFYDDEVLNDVMNNFIEYRDLDIVYGDLVYVSNVNVNKVIRKWISLDYFYSFFDKGNVPPHPSLFLKKSVYLKAGKFNLSLKLAADYEFMLRIFKKFNFKTKYINKTFVRMRLGGASNKNVLNILNQNIEILKAWKINNLKVPLMLMPLRLYKRLIQFV